MVAPDTGQEVCARRQAIGSGDWSNGRAEVQAECGRCIYFFAAGLSLASPVSHLCPWPMTRSEPIVTSFVAPLASAACLARSVQCGFVTLSAPTTFMGADEEAAALSLPAAGVMVFCSVGSGGAGELRPEACGEGCLDAAGEFLYGVAMLGAPDVLASEGARWPIFAVSLLTYGTCWSACSKSQRIAASMVPSRSARATSAASDEPTASDGRASGVPTACSAALTCSALKPMSVSTASTLGGCCGSSSGGGIGLAATAARSSADSGVSSSLIDWRSSRTSFGSGGDVAAGVELPASDARDTDAERAPICSARSARALRMRAYSDSPDWLRRISGTSGGAPALWKSGPGGNGEDVRETGDETSEERGLSGGDTTRSAETLLCSEAGRCDAVSLVSSAEAPVAAAAASLFLPLPLARPKLSHFLSPSPAECVSSPSSLPPDASSPSLTSGSSATTSNGCSVSVSMTSTPSSSVARGPPRMRSVRSRDMYQPGELCARGVSRGEHGRTCWNAPDDAALEQVLKCLLGFLHALVLVPVKQAAEDALGAAIAHLARHLGVALRRLAGLALARQRLAGERAAADAEHLADLHHTLALACVLVQPPRRGRLSRRRCADARRDGRHGRRHAARRRRRAGDVDGASAERERRQRHGHRRSEGVDLGVAVAVAAVDCGGRSATAAPVYDALSQCSCCQSRTALQMYAASPCLALPSARSSTPHLPPPARCAHSPRASTVNQTRPQLSCALSPARTLLA
ncbi:hypothetical protein FA09DRAFT_181906 [Tilletiopsis washingtonensis]|uniref:Uncharacterized protein n=1 Tax=Tilletiopsis washingtonensis TaxID=58919 RepID=A0A316ZGD3_9BASI|nr:hypothetical protein FA09DRAFT_181906 [Tilletiopsis washingtonensis]PWO00307.1 hypothetical protein FA09DRAFT_181906 [Tilletiopsis washingtonensis]